MPTPHDQNQLRSGRGIATLQQYKALLGEHGLADTDTLADLLTDLCHATSPSTVLTALQSACHHHHAETSATEDDPEGDAASARYRAIGRYAERNSTEGVSEVDKLPILSEGDDNGCYVLGWQWQSFNDTAFDKEVSPEQRMANAIRDALGDHVFRHHCGLNADWSVTAWPIKHDVHGTKPNTGSGFYLLDNENGTASLVWRRFDGSPDDPIIQIHQWPDSIAFCGETPETLKARCVLPEWHCGQCEHGFKEPTGRVLDHLTSIGTCPHCGSDEIEECTTIIQFKP